MLTGVSPAKAVSSLTNGNFEQPSITGADCNNGFGFSLPCISTLDASRVPGWKTTASDNKIEFWTNGALGYPAYEGSQFVELNANEVSTLYQDISGIAAGNIVGYEFAHRGRDGTDVMALTITDLTTTNVLFTRQFSTGQTWTLYSNPNALTATGNPLRFAYASVSASGSDPSAGNFLDAAQFGVGIGGSTDVPGPLPLLGAGTAFGFSRRLRRRLRKHQQRS